MEDLLAKYVDNAVLHGEGTEIGDHLKTNAAHDALVEVCRAIKEKDSSLKVLLPLLEHNEISVRGWAATHLLPVAESSATKVLEVIANGDDLFALSAKMVLKEWRDGTLKL